MCLNSNYTFLPWNHPTQLTIAVHSSRHLNWLAFSLSDSLHHSSSELQITNLECSAHVKLHNFTARFFFILEREISNSIQFIFIVHLLMFINATLNVALIVKIDRFLMYLPSYIVALTVRLRISFFIVRLISNLFYLFFHFSLSLSRSSWLSALNFSYLAAPFSLALPNVLFIRKR